jgi:hypothetical protein
MNKHFLVFVTAIAIAIAIAAPVIATDRKAKAAAQAKCGMFAKYDNKTKSCQKR